MVLSSRAASIERLFSGEETASDRLAVWAPISDMVWNYFPVGSGIGSFVEVYQVDEPRQLLTRNYLNHAHNDWLEIVMTAGAPGAMLVLAALGLWLVASASLFRAPISGSRTLQLGRLGSVLIGLLGLASIVDYPVRTPALMCLFAFAAMWTEDGMVRRRERRQNGSGEAEERGGSSILGAVAGRPRRMAEDD